MRSFIPLALLLASLPPNAGAEEPLPQTYQNQLRRIENPKPLLGLDAGARFNHEGFWNLPIPVSTSVSVDPQDVVIYDAEGYAPLRDFL